MNGWKLVFEDHGSFSYAFPSRCFESISSGLQVMIADVQGPMVHSFISLRTETHDDRGLPHCLEHLCFLGTQEKYPYKGLLDVVAQSILSSGTNAWTAQDNTTYTLSAASRAGLLNVLPLFMDHVFFPLLHSEHYLQEVFAINGAGEDIGVVFSEMQGLERKLSTLSTVKMAELLYPNSSYCAETGGKMYALRDESTMNMEAVRDYHQRYYRPNNALVCVTGAGIDAKELLSKLQDVDSRLARLKVPNFVRPFMTVLPPPPQPERIDEMDFPAETEDFGQVDLGWRFQETLAQMPDKVCAFTLLLDYLCEGISAPLHHHLVDREDPLCRSVSSHMELYHQPSVMLSFEGATLETIGQIKDAAMQVLREQVQSFDMKRMTRLIEKAIMDEISEIEQSPSEHAQQNGLLAFLYFPTMNDTPRLLWGQGQVMRDLLTKDVSFWTHLLRETFLTLPLVGLVSRPSSKLHAQYAAQDKLLVQQRVDSLGKEGLERLQSALDEATEKIENSTAPAQLVKDLIAKLNVDLSRVSLHELHTWRSAPSGMEVIRSDLPSWLQVHLAPLNALPCCMVEVDHCPKTAFVDLAVFVMGLDHLNSKEKRYLELFCELMFKSPIGTLSHTQVADSLDEDLISYSAGIGLTPSNTFSPGAFPSVLHIFARAKVANYAKMIEHVRSNLHEANFLDQERIAVAVQVLLGEVAESERSHKRVLSNAMRKIVLEPSCVSRSVAFDRQKKFLARFERNPTAFVKKFQKVVRKIRSHAHLGNMIIHMVANMAKVWVPDRPWYKWPHQAGIVAPLSLVKANSAFLRDKKKIFAKGRQEHVIPMPIDGGSAQESWEGPSFNQESAVDIPALLVLTEMLSMQEGPLWIAIRGKGLAYGAYVYPNPQVGLVELHISECSSTADMVEALKAAHEVFAEIDQEFVRSSLETAKSIALGTQISRLETHQGVAENRLLSTFKGYTTEIIIHNIAKVSVADVVRVWKLWIQKKLSRGSQVVMVISNDEGIDEDEGDGDDDVEE